MPLIVGVAYIAILFLGFLSMANVYLEGENEITYAFLGFAFSLILSDAAVASMEIILGA